MSRSNFRTPTCPRDHWITCSRL